MPRKELSQGAGKTPIFENQDPKPFFCYLEGGPGFGNAKPQDSPVTHFLVDRGYKVIFVDYRGTGFSTPISAATLALQGDDKAQARYLKFFRADSIVMDLEAVRLKLTAGYPEELHKWSIIGQSFGGFVSLTYLSFFPKSLTEVFLTGGLAPVNKPPKVVYTHLADRVCKRNAAYYSKYSEDRDRVFEIATYLKKTPVVMPHGGYLSAERFMGLGIMFGSHGGLDAVHEIVLRIKTDLDTFGFPTFQALSMVEDALPFETNPIYAILHEAIYNYEAGISSNWAAYRVVQNDVRFSWLSNPKQLSSPHKEYEQELYFSGEMVFPFHFDTFAELKQMKGAADILARTTDWSQLYDVNTLQHNTVPVYAACYLDDMYVDFDLAQETAGMIKTIKTYITNALYHNAIRAMGDKVLQELFRLRDDTLD